MNRGSWGGTVASLALVGLMLIPAWAQGQDHGSRLPLAPIHELPPLGGWPEPGASAHSHVPELVAPAPPGPGLWSPPQPIPVPAPFPPAAEPFCPSPLPQLAVQILATNGAFLNRFLPTAKDVPDGKNIRKAAERLQEAACAWRRALLVHDDLGALQAFAAMRGHYAELSARAEAVACRAGLRHTPTLNLIRGTGSLIRQARLTMTRTSPAVY